MKGDYPRFKSSYSHEELIEYFLLSEVEQKFVNQCRGDVNRHGVAVLLKSLQYLGYFPGHLSEVPTVVKSFIAKQLNLLWDPSEQYPWDARTRDNHFALIREHTGFRFPKAHDKEDLENWLQREGALDTYTEEDLFERAVGRLRLLLIELPSEKEFRRIVNSALSDFFQDVHYQVTDQLSSVIREKLDKLLIVPKSEGESFSDFDKVKDEPDRSGVKSLHKEIIKLQTLRSVGIISEHFINIPFKVIQLLKRRAKNENAGEMQKHPDDIRYGLMACFIYIRSMEIIDDIVKMFLEMIHRIDLRAERQLDRELLKDIKRVEGKTQILFRVAEAVVENPDGIIREVIFPKVKEETFCDLVAEFKASGPQYRLIHQLFMKEKYNRHYRRMLPLVLENITFKSGNRFQPVIKALSVIKRYLRTTYKYFPDFEEVPIEGVVTGSWLDTVLESDKIDGETKVNRINRKYYELCVLQKLEKALRCKEIWVEGSYAFRDPNEDLPPDWNDEEKRASSYQSLNQPIEVKSFIDPIRQQMIAALTAFNRTLADNPHVKIYFPGGGEERGLFSVDRLVAQPEPQNLGLLKEAIQERYGMIDLLDVFVEADRLVDFTRFFTHSGIKEIRSREVLRPLIIIDLFGEGTNMGIKRVAKANQKYSYTELLYVRKTYFSPEALRNAIGAVVNKILHIRSPHIWGEGNACASDGKRFGAWSQNLMSEWRTRHKDRGYGVMIYWHVETNAVCIYSQLKNFSSSEVAAMIEGLIRHDTEMRVEKNFVDSHGQSEVAFAFCRLLREFRLMPRLKRIKYERLYLPDKGMASSFPNLSGILSRPIRWELIEQQYDEMVKATVAMKYGYGTPEAILKRFNSYNVTHPTYKALAELGKVEKTIFLCEYLSSVDLRREINEGLNVVENWNATNEFIFYGRGGELATNSREDQEISALSLHLLQNCLILINTILLERTIEQRGMLKRLRLEDLRALTPLFHSHINPYGLFELDLEKPSFLEAA